MLDDLESKRAAGFSGFISIRELRASKLLDVPNKMGVYLVLRLAAEAPVFLDRSPAGHFKGEEPVVPVEELQRNWVSGTPLMYVGKAGGPAEDATLQSRLGQYLAFGVGRLIWQLADAEDLVVCWKSTPTEVPREVEQRLVEKFKASHSGRRPFANLQD